jgi:hypothetical protein
MIAVLLTNDATGGGGARLEMDGNDDYFIPPLLTTHNL